MGYAGSHVRRPLVFWGFLIVFALSSLSFNHQAACARVDRADDEPRVHGRNGELVRVRAVTCATEIH